MATRREFLRSASAASVIRSAQAHALDRKLRLGLIGAGWQGRIDRDAAYEAGNVEWAAVSDVDSVRLFRVAAECEKAQGSRPKILKDYRDLLEVPGLDAVVIATPSHWQALPFIAACAKGLPVYQETPFCYDIPEGRAMVAAWRAAGNIVQVGFQRRRLGAFQGVCDYIRSGQAGRVVQVEVQVYRQISMPKDARPVQEPPPSLDWDAWCGPAARLPYRIDLARGGWRLEREYGKGVLVEEGIHWIDAVRSILEESVPCSASAAGGIYRLQDEISTPDTLTAHFEFARCPVVWRHHASKDAANTADRVTFYGTKRTVVATDHRDVQDASGSDRAGVRHMAEFLACVRAGRQPSCTPDDAFRSAATVHLAMASYEGGTRLRWDGAQRLPRDYRAPYVRPNAADYRV